MRGPLRIANCSGFYGDRLSAAREMVEGGPIDVLTGDYLAELTLMILLKDRMKDPQLGYARTFLRQLEEVVAACAERGIKIVVNAGGLNPAGCAEAARAVYERLGVRAHVAHVEGDDLMPKLEKLQTEGEPLTHLDKGVPLASLDAPVVSANAYLGGWGIAAALEHGADVVICPRVTDAALSVGPAAWKFGWARDDWDRLASAVVAGHIIECGAQCTGGNYSFFDEVPDLTLPGFPIAEIDADGSFVITKHPGSGGLVSVGTVTAQLLYEIAGPEYPNPDVTARFDTVQLSQEGPDRVRVRGVRGEPPPATTKVCINYLGGFRNSVTFVLAGLDIEAKACLAEETLWKLVGGEEQFAETKVSLRRSLRHADDLGEGPRRAEGRARLLGQGDRDGARQLPGLHDDAPAGPRVALRGLLAGARSRSCRRAPRHLGRGRRPRHSADRGSGGLRGAGAPGAAGWRPPRRSAARRAARRPVRRPLRRQGRQRQRRRVGAQPGGLPLAGGVSDRPAAAGARRRGA
jgi:hypothetical protein